MSANIIKLVLLCITLTVLLAIAGLQLFNLFNLEAYTNKQQFAWGMGAGAFIASLATGIILLIKPYSLPIKKQTLFIGNLAFTDPALIDAVKLGVLSGSLIAAVAGYLLLKAALPDTVADESAEEPEESAQPAAT